MRGSDKHPARPLARPRTRRGYRPFLEQMEERALPGDAAWWALPAPAGCFGPALPAAFEHEKALGVHTARAGSGTQNVRAAAGPAPMRTVTGEVGPATPPARTSNTGAAPEANRTDHDALSTTLIATATPP